MSSVSEVVVREFFESLGYLVTQPRKHVSPGRHKTAEEELDFVVCNPSITEQVIPDHLVWEASDLSGVARAIVGVRGWHTDRFYASTFEQTPDILRFAEEGPVRHATRRLGSKDVAKILCLPRLPASGDLKKASILLLKEKGIDGVISFRTMLLELVRQVDAKRNYEKSDLLQTIRILKNYELLRDEQLDLFTKGKRRRSS